MRARACGSGTTRRSISAPNIESDQEEVYFDDEETDIGKTLHAKDGKVENSTLNNPYAYYQILVGIF